MGNAAADHTFESTETAANWTAAATLVLIRGALQDVELEGEVAPATAVLTWTVERASDDHASLGAGLPTLTPDRRDNKKANLKVDETGSFLVRAFVDCDGDGHFDRCDPFKLFQIVMVHPTLHADNSVTHAGHITATVADGALLVRSGSFNIDAPATEAIHMNSTVNVVSGGPDGRRLIDRVFAGWINNERLNENLQSTYDGGHSRFYVFASNRDSATGANNTFLPGDPAPVLVAPPLLDTGRPGAGTGGDTATLTRSRIQLRSDRPVGQRWIVECVDSPGSFAPLTHPAFGTRLMRYHFELSFRACLSFWTNHAGVSGRPADRVYACLRSYNWNMLGEWTVDAAGTLTTVSAMTVTISGSTTNSPCKENHNDNSEVRHPTSLSLLAKDARG